MSPLVERQSKVTFGLFEVDLQNGELWKAGKRIKIQSQPFKVLAALLERPAEVVSKEELQLRLWGKDTTVDFDHSLGTAVNKIREALGDSADNPRFIETLARRGYRFIAPVGSSPASRTEASGPALVPAPIQDPFPVNDLPPESFPAPAALAPTPAPQPVPTPALRPTPRALSDSPPEPSKRAL